MIGCGVAAAAELLLPGPETGLFGAWAQGDQAGQFAATGIFMLCCSGGCRDSAAALLLSESRSLNGADPLPASALPQWAWLPAPTAPWRGATTACWSRYWPA